MSNPFTDAYMAREVKAYGVKEYEKGAVKIRSMPIIGRCDDYLNVQFRTKSPLMPIMTIDGELWMSLSFMEIQSQYLPILRAKGKVATGGLGLGYYAMRVAQKDEVESLDVYEKDPRVIEFFMDKFKRRKWFKKITLIEGDVRRLMKDCTYDLVYMDIYQTLLPDAVIKDAETFQWENYIDTYHFWGQELVLWNALEQGIDVHIEKDEGLFFSKFMKSPGFQLKNAATLSEKFIRNCLSAMGRDYY